MIPIRNIYYMLAYAFQQLNEKEFQSINPEEFEDSLELLTEILIKGITAQLKHGLNKSYVLKTESLASPKGKIQIADSIKANSMVRNRLVCSFDEFSENNYLNQVLKTTSVALLRKGNFKSERNQPQRLRNLMRYFSNVDNLRVDKINWNYRFTRNNRSYSFLLTICRFIIEGLIQTEEDGNIRVKNYFDDQFMSHLYEKFILEYYRKHYPFFKANPDTIPWQLNEDDDSYLLPGMHTDVTLHDKDDDDHILIIDAKYYSKSLSERYGKPMLHSSNLYQIFTYVKNKEYELRDHKHTVSGMLLYAKTDAEVQPDSTYTMSGNRIYVRSLDLKSDFELIKAQLNEIIENEFKPRLS